MAGSTPHGSGLRSPLIDDEEEAVLAAAAATFSAASADVRAGADDGWFGVAVPEQFGGAGGTVADLASVIDAAGATLAASAVVWTTGIASQVLLTATTPPSVLERFTSGQIVAAVPTAGSTSPLALRGSAMSLNGDVLAVGVPDATLVLPLEAADHSLLALVPAGHPAVSTEAVPAMDPTRPWVRFQLRDVQLDTLDTVDVPDVLARWRAAAGLGLAADSVGAARAALQRTIDYAQTREQFGRPIGSFQTYKHRCADAYISVAAAQSVVRRAAANHDGTTLLRLTAACHALGAMTAICAQVIQLHGGVGFSQESGLHLHLRRTRANEILAGIRHGTTRQLLDAYITTA